ncbi:MAG: PAS domain-containing sensor histidine kinase [Ginsengibacter sp.]
MNIEHEKKRVSINTSKKGVFLEEQFLDMANSAPVLLWVSNADNLRIFFNKAWLQFTGRTPEEEYGNGWLEGIHPNDLKKCIKIYKESFEKREAFKMEYRLRRNDGQYRWILDNGKPRYTKNKIFDGYIGSCVDIHEIKELEHRKGQFITAASHELKTPVTSLNVYLHLIEEYFKNNKEEKYASFASGAVEQVNKITELINHLLDLSRLQSGSLHFEWSVFSFYKLVNSIVKKIQLTTPTHRIEIQGSSKAFIKGDSERLLQAIENVLTNAIKYSENHDKIIVKLSENTKFVNLSVIDFGTGIDKIHLPKIFDRFYRIPGEKEETYPGLGIGLYLSQQIVKNHKGKIWVESIRNKETKFNLQIPVHKQTDL